jgi:hypothetical protein
MTTTTTLRGIVAGLALACACGPAEGDTTMTTTDDTAVPVAGARTAELRQGTTLTLGACRLGLVAVTTGSEGPAAHIAVAHPATRTEVTLPVRRGQLLPACGGLHRVREVVAGPASARPGAGSSSVVLELERAPTPAVGFLVDSAVLAPGGRTQLGGATLELVSVTAGPGGRARAHVESWPGRTARADARADQIRGVDLGAEDVLELAGKRHRVRSLVPPDARAGVPGWLEIESKPLP